MICGRLAALLLAALAALAEPTALAPRSTLLWYAPSAVHAPTRGPKTDMNAAMAVVKTHAEVIDAVIMMCGIEVTLDGSVRPTNWSHPSVWSGGQGGSYTACLRGATELPQMGVAMWALSPAITNITLFRKVGAPDRVATLVASFVSTANTLGLKVRMIFIDF